MKPDVFRLWRTSRPFRFLVAGAWNFAFGYACFAVSWRVLGDFCPGWLVVAIASLFGITNTFLVHRFLTYRSRGKLWREYLRFWSVYGVQTFLNMLLVDLFVDCLGFNAYLSQLVIALFLTIGTYWAHKFYSFKGGMPC